MSTSVHFQHSNHYKIKREGGTLYLHQSIKSKSQGPQCFLTTKCLHKKKQFIRTLASLILKRIPGGGFAVSIGEAARHRVFCCVDVAVSIGEAAKPRVFCCVDVAVSIGEAAKPRVFCCVDVAVSIGEAGKPRVVCCVDVAVSIGEAAKPRVFCYVDDAVSIGEAGKPRVFCPWMSPCL